MMTEDFELQLLAAIGRVFPSIINNREKEILFCHILKKFAWELAVCVRDSALRGRKPKNI